MSDMGHSLASIVGTRSAGTTRSRDTALPDTSSGSTGSTVIKSAATISIATPRDNFLIELAKHGLGLRDIVANVNFFTKVSVNDDGKLHFRREPLPGRRGGRASHGYGCSARAGELPAPARSVP